MSGGRKFLVGFISVLLFLLITTGLPLAAMARVSTNRSQLKLVLANKAVYNALADNLVKNNTELSTTPADTAQQSVENEALKKIIDKYFGTDTYTQTVNSVVDSTYDWLEGKTEQPKFNISFASNQAEFQQFVSQVFTDRFNNLPVCSAPIDPTTYNPLEATCRANEYSAEDVNTFINDQASSPELAEFYKNASINSSLVFGQIDPQTTDSARGWYNVAKLIPIIFGGLYILLICLIFLTAFKWRRGFKIAALATLIPSLLTLFSAVVFMAGLQSTIAYLLKGATANLSSAMSPAIIVLGAQITNQVILASGILAFISIVSLALLFFTKPKTKNTPIQQPPEHPEPSLNANTDTSPLKPPTKPKERKP